MRRLFILGLCFLFLTACASAPPAAEEPPPPEPEIQEPEPPPAPVQEPYEIKDPTQEQEGYVPWTGIVEHLFFHPVIAYPELAFDGDNQANGLDDFMVTVDEYNKILQSVYDKGYILVDINSVWSEEEGEDGPHMVRNTEGILGYRTQTDTKEWDDAKEANRQKEREAVQPIVEELRRTGWTFGSHTWGHIRLGDGNMTRIQADTQRWLDEVGSLVGETAILFYPHGERPDGNDWTITGPAFRYLQSQGFRVFCSVGVESFSFIKKDISAVICDRLHPDGTTLRHSRDRYLQFYDAKDIIDLEVRPQREVSWTEE
ncbi:MAG: hydrolase [Oscillibacter sp.]|nr:hydrolase [Oscillibacter sp.]